MRSIRKAKKAWHQWDRYLSKCLSTAGDNFYVTKGCEKAYNRWAAAVNHRNHLEQAREAH